MSNCDNMGVVREDLKRYWIHHLPHPTLFICIAIARKVQSDEIFLLEGFPGNRIGAMLSQPRADYLDIEDRTIGRADRMFKGLETGSAEIER